MAQSICCCEHPFNYLQGAHQQFWRPVDRATYIAEVAHGGYEAIHADERTYKGVQFHSCYMVQQRKCQLQGHADHIMHGEINSNMWQPSGIQCRTSQNYKSLLSCSCFMVQFRDDSPLEALSDYHSTSTCLMDKHMVLPPGNDTGYGDYKIITHCCPRFQPEQHEANCYSTTSPDLTLHTTGPCTDLQSQILHEMSFWYLGLPRVRMYWRHVKLISAIERWVPSQPQNVSVITIAEVVNDAVHYSLGMPRESLCEEFLAGGASTTVSVTALLCKSQLQKQRRYLPCHSILMIELCVTHNFYMASTGVQVALQEGRDVSLHHVRHGRDYYLNHDRFSELVQVHLNYGYYNGAPGMIKDLQAPWDPGLVIAARGQAAFQEGRDVRDLFYIYVGCQWTRTWAGPNGTQATAVDYKYREEMQRTIHPGLDHETATAAPLSPTFSSSPPPPLNFLVLELDSLDPSWFFSSSVPRGLRRSARFCTPRGDVSGRQADEDLHEHLGWQMREGVHGEGG
ncbi:unnamed protein product [Triticum aestivum]|uniref:Uncharacterized protein n=1 Tax=Triticum aestivum TaxID=4565 RepID=A0A7H4LHL3_WHEAT|nr:unnamed protein product [Triticum aestivum]